LAAGATAPHGGIVSPWTASGTDRCRDLRHMAWRPMRSFPEPPTVEAFLEASLYAGSVLASDAVRLAWADPSAVEMMTVGDIGGHMFLVVRRVGKRLESALEAGGQDPAHGQAPAGRQAPAPGRADWAWAPVNTTADLELPEHRQVRMDGAHVAAWGWEEVHNAYNARVRHVGEVLRLGLPATTGVAGHDLPFSAYLATRVVELVVHTDDLICSVGLASAPPHLALTTALDALVDGSRSVHGDLAVLRALSRPERVTGQISVF